LKHAFDHSQVVWDTFAQQAVPGKVGTGVGELALNDAVVFKGTSGWPRALPPALHAAPPVPAWVFPAEYAQPEDWANLPKCQGQQRRAAHGIDLNFVW
jgi:hypothetical protein